MRKLVKSLLLLPLGLIVVAVIFIVSIDPTRLAPLIQEQLSKQGIEARFKGKIAWQFYPNIGLSVNDLQLHSLNTSSTDSKKASLPMLAELGAVRFSVELAPLFSRQIKVNGIQIENATINYYIDKSGASNWQSAADTQTKPAANTTSNNDLPQLRVKSFSIINSNFNYQDLANNSQLAVKNLNLNANDINIESEAFPLSTSFTLNLDKQAAIDIDTAARIAFNIKSSALAVSDLNTHISSTQLDKIHIQGVFNYAPKNEITKIDSDILIDKINLDKILALLSSGETEQPKSAAPTPLPLKPLRNLESKIQIRINSVQAFGLAPKNIVLKSQSKEGYVTIENLASDLFDGHITSQGYFDARKDLAKLSLKGSATNIDTGKLLQQLAQRKDLAGVTNTDFNIISQGTSSEELIEKLSAEASTTAKSLVLQPFNLEKQYCKLVAMLNKEDGAAHLLSANTWEAFTELQPVDLKVTYKQNIVKMEKLNATISSLLTTANGELNLESGRFNFPINLSLQALNDKISCQNISKSWLNRSLPLRCKGNINAIGIDTCLPDTDAIKNILQQKLKGEVDLKLEEEKAKLKEKAEAEKARAKAKLEEEKRRAEDKAKKKLEDKLNKLLDK